MGHREVTEYKDIRAYWEYNSPTERFYGIVDKEDNQLGGILFNKTSYAWRVSPAFTDKTFKFTSRDDREGIKRALMWVHDVREQSMSRTAATKTLDTREAEILRKDFLTLMKNTKVVKNFSQALRWQEAVRTWLKSFEDFFYTDVPRALMDLSRIPTWINRDWANNWIKRLKEDLWGLIINFRVPLDSDITYLLRNKPYLQTEERAKESAFQKMLAELPKWEGRARRAARKAWKTIDEFLEWVQAKQGTVEVDLPSRDEHTTIDGFKVTIRDFKNDDLDREALTSVQEGLKRYRTRAATVLPMLLKSTLPLVIDFEVNLDYGGRYFADQIIINAHTTPVKLVHHIAHEMGHHVYKTYLGDEDKRFWGAAISGNYGTLDLWEVWRQYGTTNDFYDSNVIRQADPILYLQIQGLFDDPETKLVFQHIFFMDSLKEYLDEGGESKIIVHGKPITGYAHKNHEEAFCEALGMLVGYGPQALLPEVRSWLQVILPSIRIASLAQRVAATWVRSASHHRNIQLMKWLSKATQSLGVAEHTYVVGGAVRNFVINQPIKDLDVVIDVVASGRDSAWLATKLQDRIPVETNLTTNQYGVAILTIKGPWELGGEDMQGEVIEIASSRKESYGGPGGKGYKPSEVLPATVREDVVRREFTFNTLLWRLLDLTHGPEKAEIIDLTGCGLRDLREGVLRCPQDPDVVFSDDPTRMLRAIKFTGKYGFKIPPDLEASILRNAPKMKRMPWEAIATLLVGNILGEPTARKSLIQMKSLGLLDVVSEMVQESKPFASYLESQLRTNRNIHLLLDLMDLGVPARTPLSFLDARQRHRLQEIVEKLGDSLGQDYVEKLIKPPVDNRRIIQNLGLPPTLRSKIVPTAREILLASPELAWDPDELTLRVETTLS